MNATQVHVPGRVVEALRDVRERWAVDMCDRATVALLAAIAGHEDAATWLVRRRELYFRAVRELPPQPAARRHRPYDGGPPAVASPLSVVRRSPGLRGGGRESAAWRDRRGARVPLGAAAR